jgi:hypothetical protein
MSTQTIVGFALAGLLMVAIPGLLAWSGSRRRRRVGLTGGVLVLRMPRGHHALLGAIILAPCLGIAGMSFASQWKGHADDGLILGGIFLTAGALGAAFLLAMELRAALRLDAAGLERIGPLRRVRAAWSDVAAIDYNPHQQWFYLTLRSGRRLYVTGALDGIADFGEVALAHLPPPVLAACPDAAEALRDLAES